MRTVPEWAQDAMVTLWAIAGQPSAWLSDAGPQVRSATIR
jgi:hypothetical protein